jgi:hypothetical protein
MSLDMADRAQIYDNRSMDLRKCPASSCPSRPALATWLPASKRVATKGGFARTNGGKDSLLERGPSVGLDGQHGVFEPVRRKVFG